MKRLTIFSALIFLCLFSTAQEARNIAVKTDSIMKAFNKELSNEKYVFTEMVKNPDNFFDDQDNEIIGDTIQLYDYEHFQFYRTKKKNGYFMAEYYKGRIGNLFENEKFTYYFYNGELKLTQSLLVKHGDGLDDYGVYYFVEERRLLFDGKTSDFPYYIMRDGEGQSEVFDINRLNFKVIDARRIIYDKYTFEIIGDKIFNGQTDF
ncbi:MAG: hypothetical protein II956_01300 [Bacteroidales bacterium]|nr:hypothetical protein [Bacteroidales bacterium]